MAEAVTTNFHYIYSMGGKYDEKAREVNVRYTCVVKTSQEAYQYGLYVSDNDCDVLTRKNNLGILVHGIQGKNSEYNRYVLKGQNRENRI